MYEGAAQLQFISSETSKQSEFLYIIWLNVGGVIHLITVAKN